MGIFISYETDERRMTFYARFYGPYESRKFRPKYSSVIWAIDRRSGEKFHFHRCWHLFVLIRLFFFLLDSGQCLRPDIWTQLEIFVLTLWHTRECMTLSHKTPRNRAHTRINDICVLEFIRSFVLVTQIIYQIVPYACLRDTLETFYLSGFL